MNSVEFDTFMENVFEDIRSVRKNAQTEYSHEADQFANFRNRSEELNISMLQAWGAVAYKHDDTIRKYVKGMPGLENREPIERRILDRIVYSILLLGIVKELKSKQTPQMQLGGTTIITPYNDPHNNPNYTGVKP